MKDVKNRGSIRGRRLAGGAIAVAASCLLAVAFLAGQKASAQAQPMAEEVYSDVQVLKGIPVDEFNDTMGMFASALLLDCVGCHSPAITHDPAAFAIPTPRIQRARQMVVMMNGINRTYFGGEQRVTCFTCHNGDYFPGQAPSLRLQYSELVDDPHPLRFFAAVGAPTAEEVFGRYTEALGGADRLAAITSITGTGTYVGFDTAHAVVPMEFYAARPNKRTIVAHGALSDLIWAYDGTNGWKYQPDTPVPLLSLTGTSLTGIGLDAMASFPTQFQDAFSEWQVGYGDIGDDQVEILRGGNPGEHPVELYIDDAGMLRRFLRWTDTGAGPVPVRMDFSDYREVSGVQMPFEVVLTWTNGQSTLQFDQLEANVAIDDAIFGRPQPDRP
ncbi:MAG: photosynthetic reaction center cytochrome c subunit family protein [Acidobacteria bacterium]|nr:photosynthetic reaction center cytochrome c subunit family protein [Acidobacteriota bacterium]